MSSGADRSTSGWGALIGTPRVTSPRRDREVGTIVAGDFIARKRKKPTKAKRARSREKPMVIKRASDDQEPIARKRAIVPKKPMRTERAEESKKPTITERARER